MMLMIDNYDSFTFNVVQALGELGCAVEVRRNDAISVAEARDLAPAGLIISPGPGTPQDAGVSAALIEALAGEIPVLGICLGHQTIVEVYGGRVGRADTVMHGKTSEVYHDDRTIYAGLASPFTATRYHSLIVREEDVPAGLEVSAYTAAGEIMGARHRELPVEGVQFHPESIMSPEGGRLLANFVRRCEPAGRSV
ncbi:aminodeoxychorismate/anthranilate synthase component II [bacterium]|nr:aminodeoxychorismate/anthranilate synthase component II [bacterium]